MNASDECADIPLFDRINRFELFARVDQTIY